MSTVPTIVNAYPAPGAQGIAIGDRVWAVFDQEMDLDSINTGTFVLIGQDESPVFGPIDVTPLDEPGTLDEDILSSPYVGAYVVGTITFEKVNGSGGIVPDSTTDTTGDGTVWLTKAYFTPDKPLSPNSRYIAFLLGDENSEDDFDTGIRTRTVFDTIKTGVSGSGDLNFGGGYTGSNSRTYKLRITSGGTCGAAEYEWWDEANPLDAYTGVTTTGRRELEDGIWVECEPDGTFTTGDEFSVEVVPYKTLANNYQWSFWTGSGEILTPPSDSSASGIESITESGTGTSTSFTVSSVEPTGAEYGLSLTQTSIVITFSSNVKASSLTSDTISVKSEAANGDEVAIAAEGNLSWTHSVSGKTLTITLAADQLYNNNIVVVELDSSVESSAGITLGEDYITFFSTPYTPLYSSLRRIRMDLGSLLSDIADETIYLAILEASLAADAIAFNTDIENGSYYHFARRQYATCLAELILVRGISGDGAAGDRMTKRLGDLSVSRDGSGIGDTENRLEGCVTRWEVAIQTGGEVAPETSLKPQYAVKGSLAEDAIYTRRNWESTSDRYANTQSASNNDVYASGRRRLRTYRRR